MDVHSDDTTGEQGVLLLAGTPIGDSRYISEALTSALLGADVIAAEDTRKFSDLCRRAGLESSAKVISYFDGNETDRTPGLVAQLCQGARVVLVTDAGMPSISDPGFRLVSACIEAGIRIQVIPGPSAVLAALAVSGLTTDRFCFEGFLPRKSGARQTRLASLRVEERTMVFFEAPHRLASFLTDAQAAFGATRRGAICRELTKTYEEVIRGPLADLAAWAQGEVRGEITVVIAGAEPTVPEIEDLIAEVHQLIAQGEKPSKAVSLVTKQHNADRQELYDASLKYPGHPAARQDPRQPPPRSSCRQAGPPAANVGT
ncbi:MAG: 16S rRNA (cytidine(1402)-2'-O)-methyltransferase [Propionibacteriaceae bacterium]|nr:16S rRNA (cytidine(1402)-2'-O)-methyltransferase [Propionibacteriaceae bacterium]